ncbi:MAG: fluoride efflux transporter CrcB [Gammaproteobacteria bacterium]|nr:MAG: fluoride efflux transporter CrcB [Gammaproteobacteria bacterium]
MNQWLAIAAGGALGAVARFWVSGWVYETFGKGFPWGTLAVNVIGSFVIGLMFVILVEKIAADPVWRLFVMVGMLGAFTTFSTFSLETLQLLEAGAVVRAGANMLISVISCVLAAWGGVSISRLLMN